MFTMLIFLSEISLQPACQFLGSDIHKFIKDQTIPKQMRRAALASFSPKGFPCEK